MDVYDDNDVSAGGRRRPKERRNWTRLLADLESGRVDAVLAYASSRMYRHVRDLADLIDIAEARGVEIATVVSGTIDLTTADGRMLARILADVDQREWEADSERWKDQKRRAVAAGRYTGGEKEPFGYRRTKSGLTIDPDEAGTAARGRRSTWSRREPLQNHRRLERGRGHDLEGRDVAAGISPPNARISTSAGRARIPRGPR